MNTPSKTYERNADKLGVSYYQFFYKDLMKAYGVATDDKCLMSYKLKRINHEFFHRPKMSLSMMAQTIMENKARVEELETTVSYLKAFYKKLSIIEDDLNILNEKDKENTGDYEGAVKRVIKFLESPGNFLPSFMNLLIEGCSSGYLTAVWISSMVFLVQNIKDQSVLDAFHAKADIPQTRKKPSVNSLIKDLCSKVDALTVSQPKFRKNLAELLAAEEPSSSKSKASDSKSDSDSDSSPVIKKRKRKSVTPEPESEPEPEPEPEPEVQQEPKKKKKKKESEAKTNASPVIAKKKKAKQ